MDPWDRQAAWINVKPHGRLDVAELAIVHAANDHHFVISYEPSERNKELLFYMALIESMPFPQPADVQQFLVD
jgi:hypothetical protein